MSLTLDTLNIHRPKQYAEHGFPWAEWDVLNDQQLIGYLFVLIAAGNDTTRNATAGGVAALIEHPEQRDLL